MTNRRAGPPGSIFCRDHVEILPCVVRVCGCGIAEDPQCTPGADNDDSGDEEECFLAADAVGDGTEDRDHGVVQGRADHDGHQAVRCRELQGCGRIGEQEDGERVVVSSFSEAREQGNDQRPAVLLEDHRDRRFLLFLFPLGFGFGREERRAFTGVEADVEADGGEQDAQKKGQTPAPDDELVPRNGLGDGDSPGAQQQTAGDADLRPRPKEAAPSLGGVLDGDDCRAIPFAADGESWVRRSTQSMTGAQNPML